MKSKVSRGMKCFGLLSAGFGLLTITLQFAFIMEEGRVFFALPIVLLSFIALITGMFILMAVQE